MALHLAFNREVSRLATKESFRHKFLHAIVLAMTWRCAHLATQRSRLEPVVLYGARFKAKDICDTRKVLASALRNIKMSEPAKPNAIRLIDPDGEEVWRGLLQGR